MACKTFKLFSRDKLPFYVWNLHSSKYVKQNIIMACREWISEWDSHLNEPKSSCNQHLLVFLIFLLFFFFLNKIVQLFQFHWNVVIWLCNSLWNILSCRGKIKRILLTLLLFPFLSLIVNNFTFLTFCLLSFTETLSLTRNPSETYMKKKFKLSSFHY